MSIYGAISAPDLAILRATETHAVSRYLTVVEPQTVMTAQINQSSFTYPLAQLTIDNVSFGAGFAITDVLQGNDVWIGTSAGARDVFVGRIRKIPFPVPTPNTLYIEEISAGVSGVPQTYYREITNNHYVTVVRTRSIWEMFPRFEDLGGGSFVIRKDWDIAYTDQNSLPNPIANITPTAGNPVGFVDASTGKYRITLVGSNSIAVLDGNTISAYSWDIGNGALVGGALNSSTVTVEFDPGQDWVFLQVTDANGRTARAWLPVAYYDKTANDWPLQLFEISSDVRDLRGATISFTGNANELSLGDVPHGAQCYVWSEQYFGGDTTEATSDYMMGWAISENIDIGIQFPDVSFEIVGPVPLLDLVASISQRAEGTTSPTNWQETIPAYTNVKGIAAYLFYWHYRTLAELCDVRLLTGEIFQATNQPAFGALDIADSNAGRQFFNLAGRLPATFASASDGSIHMVRNPQYLQSRSSVITRMTITIDDIVSLRASRRHRLDVSVVGADGYINNPGGSAGVIPVKSQAPGLTPAQATGNAALKGMIVRSQAELNWLSGAHWANVNQPWEFEIELGPNLNVFEPALWYRLGITIAADEFSSGVFGEAFQRLYDFVSDPASEQTRNFYVQSVMVSNEGSQQSVTLRVVPELTPTPGVTIPIPQPVDYPETVTNIGPPAPPQNASDFYLNLGTYTTSYEPSADAVYALVESPTTGVAGYIVSCDDFINAVSPTWVIRAQIPDVPGETPPVSVMDSVCEFLIDPADRNRGWLIVDFVITRNARIYLCENLSINDQTWEYQSRIISGFNDSSARIAKSQFFPTATAIATKQISFVGSPPAKPYLHESLIRYSRDGAWSSVNETALESLNSARNTELQASSPPYSARGIDCDKYGNDIIITAIHTLDAGDIPRFYTARISGVLGGVPGSPTISTGQVGAFTTACAIDIPWLTLAGADNTTAQFALAALPTFPSTVIETASLYQTVDGGSNWTDETPTISGDTYGVPFNSGHGLAVSPLNGQRWAMCGYPLTGVVNSRALATTDAGSSWSTLATTALVAPDYDNCFYCCESWLDSNGNEILAYGGTGNIYVSTDWASVSSRAGNLTALIGAGWTIKSIQPAYRGEYE